MSRFELKDSAEMVEKYISEIREFISGNKSNGSVHVDGSMLHPEFPSHYVYRHLIFEADRYDDGLRITDLRLTSEFSRVLGAVMPILENSDKFKSITFAGKELIESIPYVKMGYAVLSRNASLEPIEVWKVLVAEGV